MKIAEVVSGYQQGKDLANKLTSPSRWLDNTKIKQDYQRGQDIANRITDPKQWFRGKSTAPREKTPTDSKISSVQTRQSLQRAGQGQPLYRLDVETLKSIHNQVKTGKVRSLIDARQLADTIKAAYEGRPLTDQQKDMLIQFSKQL